MVASHAPPTGDLAYNPGMCPDWELNWRPLVRRLALNLLSHTSQGQAELFYHNRGQHSSYLGGYLIKVVILMWSCEEVCHVYLCHQLEVQEVQDFMFLVNDATSIVYQYGIK